MAANGGISLSMVLTNEELDELPEKIRLKIETFINDNLEEYLTAKAVYETTKLNSAEKIKSLSDELIGTKRDKDSLQNKLNFIQDELKELKEKYTLAESELSKCQEKVRRLEEENCKFRQERNLAVDDREEALQMIERRDAQLKRLQDDVKDISGQLEAAIRAKCVAIAKNDDLESRKMELDYKEKAFNKEKKLLLERINALTCDVAKHSTDLTNLRREHTGNMIVVQGKLSETTEELRQALTSNTQLTETIESLKSRVESLTQKLVTQREIEAKLNEDYHQEIKAQTKLADLYKGLSEQAASKNAELSMAAKEFQKLLNDASQRHGDLETKLKEEETKHKAVIDKKNECIMTLKKELEHANELVNVAKQEKLNVVVEGISPAAAAAGRLIKSGMTMTQIYSLYAQVSEELILEQAQTKKLNLYINTILKEIEEKAPILKKQREDYDHAMNTIEALSVRIDEMENECTKLRHSSSDAEKKVNYLTRENKRLSGTVADLSRQVCFLLKEVEESRGVAVPLNNGHELPLAADIKTSADVIAKHLVTFGDIQELQSTNQKMLVVIRELSEKQEHDEEEREHSKVKELKEQLRVMQVSYDEMLENDKQIRKILEMVKKQRDMFKTLYNQQIRGVSVQDGVADMEVENELEMVENPNLSSTIEPKKPSIDKQKLDEWEKKFQEKERELASIRSEFTDYRKEKGINEKMLNEDLERCREDNMKKIKQISEFAGKLEFAEQTIKALKTNSSFYKTQISSLESKVNNYSTLMGKHEQAILNLTNEALNATTKLARAETALEHLRVEHQLLKESEARITKERDMMLREKNGQELLLTNLEFIKSTMERTEVEGKLRLESRLEDANKECTALRLRLQDEQDRFRERVELLEKQTTLAKQRLEEEVQLASGMRAELEEAQKLLKERQEHIDSMNQKMREIKHTILPDPSTEERAKSLQEQLNQKELEVDSLTRQLSLSKENLEEFREMSQQLEKELSEVTGSFNKFKEDSSSKVKVMDEKEKEMTATINKLKEEVKTLTTNKEDAITSLRELMNIQKNELTETRDELLKNKQKLDITVGQLKALQQENDKIEKKYAAVVSENSEIQKELMRIKEELEIVREDLKKIEIEKDTAIETLNSSQKNWESLEKSLQNQIEQMKDRLDGLNKQNDTLHQQLEALGLKLSVAQPKESTSANMSLTEEEIQGTDELMQVVKYLRDEKNMAVSQHEALGKENLDLKVKVEVLTRQLEEVNHTLDQERSTENTGNATFTKHSELMKKVETVNALTEENNLLREDINKKDSRISELEQQMEKIENQVVRTNQERITKLLEQNSQLSTENVALKNESARWKQRSNTLLERTNKNSPEDFKRLMIEKENLQKQLNTEREEVKVLRADKTKLDEQLNQLRQQQQAMNEEVNRLKNEMTQVRQQLHDAKKDCKEKAEQVMKLNYNNSVQEKSLVEIRNKEMKVRQIAKKYKFRCEELSRIEENKESTSGQVSTEAQKRLREEGRREAETLQSERLKELTDQVSTTQAEADTLRKENDQLKASNADKEERAKGLLKNARQRIMQLTEEKTKTSKDLNEIRNRVSLLESTKDKLEKDKNEIQSEFERISRENELLTQRLNIMQRQLEKLQGSKPSTSSGLTDKANVEPPTANIKPMAGPSSSGSKQQPIQHSVTVTPWRGGPETPFASIRPISQSRTAAVHPTTNQSQGQAVLVPPQQQMVHTSTGVAEALSSSPTSSHTDYMPATSSAVTIRQATVPPTQSTQDMDTETESQQQGQTSSTPTQAVSIALVLPQPTAQTSSSQTTQTQVVSAENSSVVSASNQEQSLDQSIVSASSHTPSSDQSFVSASSGHTQLCSTASSYYRQQEVDEAAGQSEQSVVASSQQQLAEQSVTVSSQQAGPSEQGMSDQSVASSQQSDQSVASSHHGVSDQSVASSRQDQSVASSQLGMSEQSVASSRQTQAEQSVSVASSQTSTSSNTVTTSQSASGLKRPRDGSVPNEEGESSKTTPPLKRGRTTMSGGEGGEMLLRADGLEVEYQVPTSSQRDQEDDIILVDTTDEDEDDDEEMPDDGDMAMTSYEVGEGPDIDENITDQDNNEVEIIEDSNEVPNQSESSSSGPVEGAGGGMSEATSSGHSNVSSNQASPGHFTRRTSTIPPLNRQQQQQLLLQPQGYEDAGDDSIVPSTPTLFVPRRTDGFGEAVSSPHVPSGRFTFSDNNSTPSTRAGVAQVASEGMDDTRMDLSQLEDAGTGRSVPTTPLQVSPQEPAQGEVGQSSSDEPLGHIGDNMIPNITITVSHDMPPSSDADAELEEQVEGRLTEGSVEAMDEPELASLELPEEGGDGVSSEGEKSQVVVEDIEEGREAEASEAGPSRSSGVIRGSGTARRSNRQMVTRTRARAPPQRITWDEDNALSQRGTGQFRVRAPALTRGGATDVSRGGTAFRSRARRMRNYHSAFQQRF